MAGKKPKENVLAKWPTVEQVAKRAATIYGDMSALDVVWGRVHDGLIRTFAARSSSRRGPKGAAEPNLEPSLIGTADWAVYDKDKPDNFWRGEVGFVRRHQERGFLRETLVSYVDIRLDPADVDREFPQPVPPGVERGQRSVTGNEEETPRGPPVSLAALEAWAKAYKMAYGSTPEDKLETAYKSAAGAFPGKSVPRKSIRNLIGGNRKRGPKGPRSS